MAIQNETTSINKTAKKKAAAKKRSPVTKKVTPARKTAPDKAPVAKPEKAPVAKKPAPRKKAVVKKTVQPQKTREQAQSANRIAREKRYEMVAQMAYFRAEKRGFAPGGHDTDWLESEKAIDEMLKKQGIKVS